MPQIESKRKGESPEGLKRAEPNPIRQSLTTSLETMRDVDLGGFVINFAGANRRGSNFADVTIIGPGTRVIIDSRFGPCGKS